MHRTTLRVSLGAVLWLCAARWVAGAVVSDQTLGVVPVSASGGIYSIPAAAGLLRGGNLFHSFSQFNLVNGEKAVFGGLNGVQNVLSRVTGGASSIDGHIECAANLFLINPGGIVFGPNATVNVSGAFSVATADAIKFSDGSRFNASPATAEGDSLTSAPVSAFGFLSQKPASIEFSKTLLAGQDGSEMFFAAGEVRLNAAVLTAPSGRVGLLAVGGPGEVPAKVSDLSATPAALVPVMGAVELKEGAKVDVNGTGGGRVVIRGGKLQMTGRSTISAEHLGSGDGGGINVRTTESVSLGDGEIKADVRGSGTGGEVLVETGELSILGNYQGGIFADSHAEGSGAAVRLSAGRMAIENGFVSAKALGSGRGGKVTLNADTFLLSGYAGGVSTQSFGSGAGGSIDLNAPNVMLDGNVYLNVNASGQGAAGSVRVSATDFTLKGYAGIYASTLGTGHAGDIDVSAARLTIDSGYVFSVSSSGATGNAGGIALRSDVFLLSNAGLLNSSSAGGGRGGDVSIHAGKVTIDAASINANSEGAGAGGNIVIRTPEFLLTGYGKVSASAMASGAGGGIEISATKLSIADKSEGAGNGGGFVEAKASGTGGGGSVKLNSQELLISGYGGVFTGTTGDGAAGTVLSEPGSVSYAAGVAVVAPGTGGRGEISNGYISSDVGVGASGSGGLVKIRAGSFSIGGHLGGVSVGTEGAGRGGDAEFEVERLSLNGTVYISARSASTGASGMIRVYGAKQVSLTEYSGVYASSAGSGAAGNVLIDSERLELRGSYVQANTSGSGNAGEVSIVASKALEIDGRGAIGVTGVSVSALSGATGLGGRIRIRSGAVSVFGNADAESGITARSVTSSPAGSIVLEASSVSMDAAASISSANMMVAGGDGARGDAGSVRIELAGALSMTGASVITTEALHGNAGVLTLRAGEALRLKNSSSLTASAPLGLGGEIELTAREVIDVNRSSISARASVQGGNVWMDSHFILVNHGLLSAQAYGDGRAGNLIIGSDHYFSNESRVFATGVLQIPPIDANIANAVAPLRHRFAPASGQLQERCAMRLGAEVSSFLAVGRGGVASDATGFSLDSAVWRRGIIPPPNDKRSMFAPKGKTTRSPWQRHGIDSF